MSQDDSLRLAEIGPLGFAIGQGQISVISGERATRALAILAIRAKRGASIDELVDQCWPGHQPATARRSLANVVRRLRLALGEASIVTVGSTYRIGGDVASDRTAFLGALTPARDALRACNFSNVRDIVDEALGLWRGEPWSDVDDLDLVVADRLVLHEAYRELLTIKARSARLSNDLVSAIAGWEDLVAVNPYREESWAELALTIAAASGRRNGLQVMQRARSALTEVGLEPGPVLIGVEQRLARADNTHGTSQQDTESASPPSSTPILVDQSLPFVGRSSELDRISELLERSAAGRVGCVLLGGAPGAGKSRLALESLRRAPGVSTLMGRCIDGIDSPLGPFADLLHRSEPGGADSETSANAIFDTWSDDGHEESAKDLERRRREDALAVAGLLTERARRGPLAVLVDDLHWASPLVLLVLEILLAETTSVPLAIVATYRTNPPDLRNDIEARIAELAARPNVRHVPVGALTVEEVASLAADSGVDERPEDLHHRTGGNAFFLTETLRSGQVAQPGNDLQVLIASRLRALHPSAPHFLAVGAFLGLEFPTGPAADAVGLTGTDADGLIDDLHRAGLLVEANKMAGRSQFTHALVAEAVTEGLGSRESMRLRLALAQSLERLGFPITVWVESLLLAGSLVDNQTAVDSALAASVRFLAANNDAATIRIMDLVLERDLPPGQAAPALIRLGLAKIRSSSHVEGRVAILRAAEAATSAADGVGLAEAAMAYASGGAWADNADQTGPELLRRALTILDPGETILRARVVARLSSWAIFTASLSDRDTTTAEALELARRSGSTEALLDALNARQLAISCPVMAEESLRLDDELGELTRAGVGVSELSREPTPATYWLADGSRFRAEVAKQELEAHADRPPPIIECLSAVVAIHEGDLNLARHHQLRVLSDEPSDVDRGNALWLAVAIEWLNGSLPHALAEAEKAAAELRGLPLRLTVAWLRAETGDVSGANEILERAKPERIVGLPELFLGGFGLAGAAMAAAKLQDRQLSIHVSQGLERLGDQMIGVPWSSYPSAPFFLGVLATMGSEPARADTLFARAQLIHERMQAPAFVALTNAYWSRALQDSDPERAAALGQLANEFAAANGTEGTRVQPVF